MRRTHRGGSRGGGPRGGSQRWQQQRHNDTPMHPVPLMTDHHLGLQFIDKELELLQRKRVIIEQQQQMFSQDFMRNEPQYNQSSRFDDYSKLYDDMRTYDHPSRKRPIAVWEEDIPNKRFAGPSRAPTPRARPQRSGPMFNAGYQDAPVRVPYRALNKPQTKTPQKNFNNSKVTVKTPPVNKLDTKKLIGEANGTPDGVVNHPRLRADREPSAQMTGRLELALGSILKDIKSDPAHADAVKSVSVVRQIKKSIRDRIREVMMDQIVGPCDAIKARYRQVYNSQSDNEIVEKALQFVANKVQKIVPPEDYYKINMTKMVEARLHEMLKMLEEITCGKKQTPSTDEPAAVAADNLDKRLKEEAAEKFENREMFLALERLMSNRIIRAVEKQIPHIIHIQNLSTQFLELKNALAMETIKKLKGKNFTEDISVEAMEDISTSEAPKSPYIPLSYFAKVQGKPGLPKRNLMQAFFENYQARSVKKHRSVHNLLFVGFEDKESLDKLLAADGTKIGKSTLTIRVSNQAISKPEPDSVKAELDTSTSSDKLIGSETDEEITNLLTAIKNETEVQVNEESPEAKKEGDNHNEENTEEPENTDNQETDADKNADDTEANNENTDKISTPQTDEAVDNNEKTNTQDSNGTQPEVQNEDAEKADAVPEITDGKPKGTPVRTSARIAGTPSRIQTRRASRLVPNDA